MGGDTVAGGDGNGHQRTGCWEAELLPRRGSMSDAYLVPHREVVKELFGSDSGARGSGSGALLPQPASMVI